jgi:hypothetical protein
MRSVIAAPNRGPWRHSRRATGPSARSTASHRPKRTKFLSHARLCAWREPATGRRVTPSPFSAGRHRRPLKNNVASSGSNRSLSQVMMADRLSSVISVCLVALVSSTATSDGWVTCWCAGEPHCQTFDGVYHDFQGIGTHGASPPRLALPRLASPRLADSSHDRNLRLRVPTGWACSVTTNLRAT